MIVETAKGRERKKQSKRKTKKQDALIALHGSERLRKVTSGILFGLWAIQEMDSEDPEPFDREKVSDEEVLIASMLASSLIAIRDGLEIGK